MTGRTHFVAGLLAGEIVVICTHTAEISGIVDIMSIAALAALFPDIDHPYSKISKKNILMKNVSKATTSLFKHRGFTHTVFFAVIFAALTGFIYSLIPFHLYSPVNMSAAALCGMFSHLILDSLNPTGIMWLWPETTEHYSWAKIRTGKKGDTAVRIMLSLVTTAGIVFLAYKQIHPDEIIGAWNEAISSLAAAKT